LDRRGDGRLLHHWGQFIGAKGLPLIEAEAVEDELERIPVT
jgi:hypothetical protein